MASARSFVAIATIFTIILTACGGGGGGQGATNLSPVATTPPPVTPPVAPPVTPSPNAYGYGDKRIVVAHFKFADTGADPFPVSETVARTERVAAFFKEISYGKSTQIYDVKPWTTLPKSKSQYQALDELGRGLVTEATKLAANQYDLRQTDILVLVVTPIELGYPSCITYRTRLVTQGVTKDLSVVVLSGYDIGCSNADTMSHEIMHAYGLPSEPMSLHTSLFTCRTWQYGLPASFTDPAFNPAPCEDFSEEAVFYPYAGGDVLGGYRGHPSAFWKHYFGWIATEQVVNLSAGGTTRLDPYEPPGSGPKGAQIDLGQDQAGKPAAYWLEYRTASSRSLEEGINLAEWGWQHGRVRVWVNLNSVPEVAVQGGNSNINQSKLFSFLSVPYGLSEQVDLAVGDTFRDPHRGVTVSRGMDVGKQATVTVAVSPLVTSAPIGIEVPVNKTQAVMVTNAGMADVTQGPLLLKGRTPTAFRLTVDSCSNTTLKPGSTCSFTVTHVPEAGASIVQLAHVEWTTNDPVRPHPTVGLVGTP